MLRGEAQLIPPERQKFKQRGLQAKIQRRFLRQSKTKIQWQNLSEKPREKQSQKTSVGNKKTRPLVATKHRCGQTQMRLKIIKNHCKNLKSYRFNGARLLQ
jgi:hypothetical protein